MFRNKRKKRRAMSPIQMLRDDNGEVLTASMGGLRAVYTATGSVSATTGAGIAELGLAALNVAANQSPQGEIVLRVTATTNPCWFSLGPAATVPGANTNMLLIPVNTEVFVKARSVDVSAYHQQITGAATLNISVRV